MLNVVFREYYQVKMGQSLKEIADYFSVSERLIVRENGLSAPPKAGQILLIPKQRGNAYTVKAGDTKALLCGSEENYAKKNGTDIFYIGMFVRI